VDCRTGRIYLPPEFAAMAADQSSEPERFKEMVLAPIAKQLNRKPPRVGRNELCPCGSGKKFKRCCFQA
jgi:uncharacterized protein YecA (UPF0149 family)